MNQVSNRRTMSVAGLGLSALAVMGSAVVLSSPAAAEPPLPPDVWIQCSGFSGPNTTWPHPHWMHRSWRGGRFGLYAAHSARHGDNLLERTVPGWGELSARQHHQRGGWYWY